MLSTSIKTIFLISFLMLLLIGCSEQKINETQFIKTLTLGNDSIYLQCDEDTLAFPFSAIGLYDTVNSEAATSMTIYSTTDTLIFTPDSIHKNIKVISGENTKFLTVTYFKIAKNNYSDKLNLLKEYAVYNSSNTKNVEFTYSTPNNKNLIELRKQYNLESVAGNGSEISKIINLLHWANKIVRHNGSTGSANPNPKNALNIIETCQKENKGVNCRMMATLLNEAYLSMGFKSRHITCLPYDKADNDCHVINIVYSDSLKKWLYVDPTFAAYFFDADSNFLSIEEVRKKIIKGEKLLLPNDINWNGQPKEKIVYLAYMAKNLFRFSSPIRSEFGYESKKGDRAWVNLNPVGYDDSLSGTVDTYNKQDITNTTYHTNDDAYFWIKPN